MMRRVVSKALLTFLMAGGCGQAASINFASQESGISIGSGGRLNINSPNGMLFGGTLRAGGSIAGSDDGSVTGEAVLFQDGALVKDGIRKSVISGSYQSSSDVLTLNNGFLVAEPSIYYTGINVTGNGTTRIYGSPVMDGDITLEGASTWLSIGAQDKLSANIRLNGGTVQLWDDLRLADPYQIYGPGNVAANDLRLYIGSTNATTWSSDLTFTDGPDIELSGDLVVNGTWTINGASSITGNGHYIDITNGKMVVQGEVGWDSLRLTDVTLRGVSSSTFSTDANTNVSLDGAQVEFSGNTSFTQGKVTVDRESTLVLNGHTVAFSGTGVLVVDDRLNVDDRTQPGIQTSAPGILAAPGTIYTAGAVNNTAIAAGITAGNIILGSEGLISAALPGDDGLAGQELTNGAIVDGQTVNFDVLNVSITHDKPAQINAKNVVVDGKGGSMTFAGSAGSGAGTMFKVGAGASVKLQNITLANVTQDTFDLNATGSVTFGEHVTLLLGGDVVLTSGNFTIADAASGANMVTVRGVNGSKRLTLQPSSKIQTSILDLGNSSLVLQDLELRGCEFITAPGSAASIALAGEATVDVAADSSLNFDVEDVGNTLALMTDGLTLSGAFSWSGSAADNLLTVKFAIPKAIADKVVAETDANGNVIHIPVKKGNPLVIFDGDAGIFLTSTNNIAGLVFADQSVSVLNGLGSNTNAFVVDANSYMEAGKLEVLGHAIKQSSAVFQLDANVIEGKGIDPAFIRVLPTGSRKSRRNRSAFAQIRESQRARLAATSRISAPAKAIKAKPNSAVKSNRLKPAAPTRGVELGGSGLLRSNSEAFKDITPENCAAIIAQYALGSERVAPAVSPATTTFDNVFHSGDHKSAVAASGNTWYDGQGAGNSEFFTAEGTAFIIELSGGASLRQKLFAPVALLADQFLIVSGRGNTLTLTNGDALVDLANIVFSPDANGDAELIVRFEPNASGKPVRFVCKAVADSSSGLLMPGNSSLTFSGACDVVLDNFVEIVMEGENDAFGNPKNRPSLNFIDGARLTMSERATAVLSGRGSVNVDSAVIDLNASNYFMMGTGSGNEIALRLSNGARVSLSNALFGFVYCNAVVELDSSDIQVFEDGVFSLGLWYLVDAPYLTSFAAANSTFTVAKGGKIWVHENQRNADSTTKLTEVDLKGLTISGMQGLGIGQLFYGNPAIYSADGSILRASQSFSADLAATGPVLSAGAEVETIADFVAPFVTNKAALNDIVVF